jgi:hypothetical protein
MNHTDISKQKDPSSARLGDEAKIADDFTLVIGSARFYLFIIKRILLTAFPDLEAIISDVEGVLGNCPNCQLTLSFLFFGLRWLTLNVQALNLSRASGHGFSQSSI